MKTPIRKNLPVSICLIFLMWVLTPSYKTTQSENISAAGEPALTTELPPASDVPSEYLIPIVYYSQSDPQWGNYLYGGSDPMSSYGCGPTVVAMYISTFTDTIMTPPQAADWAAANGYWSSTHGSVHGLIPDAAMSHGLKVESLNIKTPEALKLALSYGKLVVFLMGPGDFTDSGHFIVAYGVQADGRIKIADPARPENMQTSWDAASVLAQVSSSKDSAGPVWVISR